MKKRTLFFILINLILISASVYSFPYFAEQEEIAYFYVNTGDYFYEDGLWYMKDHSQHGYAFAFQDIATGTYNTGEREMGSFIYGPIEIPDYQDVFLAFEYLWETEYSYRYDIMQVEITIDNPFGVPELLVDNKVLRNHHPHNKWDYIDNISLSRYRGKTIYLRFSFDTMDNLYNDYQGWLVDHIVVYRNHVNSVFNSKIILDFGFDERFVDPARVLDHSGNFFYGIPQGTILNGLETNQKMRYIQVFANSKVRVPAQDKLNNLEATIFSFWFYPEEYGILACKDEQFKIYYANPGRIHFQLYNGSRWTSLTTRYTLPLNNWYHVTIMYDGSDQAAIFINGNGSNNMFVSHHCGDMVYSTNDLYIGGTGNPAQLQFAGKIASFRIADISEWITTEVNIKNDNPWPAIYSWDIYGTNDWYLDNANPDNTTKVNDEQFGGTLDLNNQAIQYLAQSIGISTDTIRDPVVIWNRIQNVWLWLQQNELSPSNPNYNAYIEALRQGSIDGWPSIQLRADLFMQYNGYVWNGTCGAYAQFFNSLLRLAGIHPDLLATFQASHLWYDGTTPNHAYSGVYLYNRWLPMDATVIGRSFPDFPNVTTLNSSNTSMDYNHPWDMTIPSGNTQWETMPILEAARYPEPISSIRLVSPPDGAIMDQDEIMVAGYFKGPQVSNIPDYVLINNKKVQVVSNYFITSLKTNFIDNEMGITVTDPEGEDSESINIFKSAEIIHAVNVGGGEYIDQDGIYYAADTSDSGIVYSTTHNIERTDDDALYQFQREGNLIYNFNVPNGEYDVIFKFAEIVPSVYYRYFQVYAEDIMVIPTVNVPYFVGQYIAKDYKEPVTVSDGTLNIQLSPYNGTPLLAAIIIRKALD